MIALRVQAPPPATPNTHGIQICAKTDLNPDFDSRSVSERVGNDPVPTTAGASTIEVPLSEEEVKVGKRTVGAGEVKLHKTITTEQVNVAC